MYCTTRFSQNDWETCQLAIVIPIEIFDHKLMTFINLEFVSHGIFAKHLIPLYLCIFREYKNYLNPISFIQQEKYEIYHE